MTPAAVLDRVTGGRGVLAVKYTMVSVIGVAITQGQLATYVGILRWDPTWANVTAVMLAAVPVFLLNKRWAWGVDGRVSMRREVIPFWIFTAAGLVLSTLLVTAAKGLADSTLLVMAANLTGFGVLWVAKFLFLDQVMFGRVELDDAVVPETVAGAGSVRRHVDAVPEP